MDTATNTIFDRPQTSDAKTTPFSQVLVTLTKEQHIQLCWEAHYWKTQHQRAISRMAQLEIEHKCAIEQGIARETALHNELADAQAKIKELKKRVFGRKSEQSKHDDKVPGATPPQPKPRGQQAGKPVAPRMHTSQNTMKPLGLISPPVKNAAANLPIFQARKTVNWLKLK